VEEVELRHTQRLDKILSNSGYGTRSEIKQMVRAGTIAVNGVTARDSGMHVDPENCVISVNGSVLNYKEFVYIMMNKPRGVISATFDNRLKTVVDILPDQYKRLNLFPAGRLDIDTEGLLLLTNDGRLAHELLSPAKHVPKRYYALIEGKVDERDKESFREGVTLDDGYRTLPADLHIIKSGSYSEAELLIYEGKFHQVKRMFEAVSKKVKYLRRIQMGELRLDDSLQPGQCRELTGDETEKLKNIEMHCTGAFRPF
jgi:16S rRNA pseudouridine516 synthase